MTTSNCSMGDIKALSHQHSVSTAFKKKIADRLSARCAVANNAAQNKRRGLVFAQRVRQRDVGTL